MSVIFREMTKEDVDYLFSLEAIRKVNALKDVYIAKPPEELLDHRHTMAVDETTGAFMILTCQECIYPPLRRWVLVRDGLVAISGSHELLFNWSPFDVEFASAELLPKLEKLLPFVQEAFALGGSYLNKIGADSIGNKSWAAAMCFDTENAMIV